MFFIFNNIPTYTVGINFFIVLNSNIQLLKTTTPGGMTTDPQTSFVNPRNFQCIQALNEIFGSEPDFDHTKIKTEPFDDSEPPIKTMKLEQMDINSEKSFDDKIYFDNNYKTIQFNNSEGVQQGCGNNIYSYLSVSDDVYTKKIPDSSSKNNEGPYYQAARINNILIPIEDLQHFQIKVFLSNGHEKINTGIIKKETYDLLNSISKKTTFYKKICSGLRIVDVMPFIVNGMTVFVNDKTCYGRNYPITIDNLTDIPFETPSKENDQLSIHVSNQPLNKEEELYEIENCHYGKISERVLGIYFEPLEIFYKDMQELHFEVKNDPNIKKLFKNFKYAININNPEYKRLEQMMNNNKVVPINPARNQYELNLSNNSIFSDINTDKKLVKGSKSADNSKILKILQEIKYLEKKNKSLVDAFLLKFGTSFNPMYFQYIKNEILRFDLNFKIDFDPNEKMTNRTYLDKKYKYLVLYHKYLQIFIAQLDFETINKFFEEQKDIKKERRLKEILEYKTKFDQKRAEKLRNYFKSQTRSPTDEKADSIHLRNSDDPREYENFFYNFESEVKYEIEESDGLRIFLIEKIVEIMHSVGYTVYDFNKLFEENNSIDIKGVKRFDNVISFNASTYVRSPYLETFNVNHKELILRFNYETARIRDIKDRLDQEIMSLSSFMRLNKKNVEINVSELKSKLKLYIYYDKHIKTFLYRIVTLKRIFEDFFICNSVKLSKNIHLLSEEEITLLKSNFKCKEKIEKDFINEFMKNSDTPCCSKSVFMAVDDEKN